jgi:hypothetical protein
LEVYQIDRFELISQIFLSPSDIDHGLLLRSETAEALSYLVLGVKLNRRGEHVQRQGSITGRHSRPASRLGEWTPAMAAGGAALPGDTDRIVAVVAGPRTTVVPYR